MRCIIVIPTVYCWVELHLYSVLKLWNVEVILRWLPSWFYVFLLCTCQERAQNKLFYEVEVPLVPGRVVQVVFGLACYCVHGTCMCAITGAIFMHSFPKQSIGLNRKCSWFACVLSRSTQTSFSNKDKPFLNRWQVCHIHIALSVVSSAVKKKMWKGSQQSMFFHLKKNKKSTKYWQKKLLGRSEAV